MIFLKKTAQELIEKYGDNFSEIKIISPNNRTKLFLKEQFKKQLEGKTSWLPDTFSIEQFVQQFFNKTKFSKTRLMIELYLSCQEINENINNLNDFFGWGQTLLQDFNDIDKHLIDANQILNNIKNISKIKQWDISGKQNLVSKYYEFMEYMQQYYNHFQKKLQAQNTNYQGGIYREIAENIEAIACEIKNKYPSRKYIFVGFNALTKSEIYIINHLCSQGVADIYWHTDEYYMNSEIQEAAHPFRKMQKENLNDALKYKSKKFKWIFKNDFSKKNIQLISTSKNISQCKIAGDILNNLQTNDYSKTCVVLCDEKLLTPMLYSIPKKINSVNVTMGLPLRNIPLTSFFENWLELLIFYKKNGKFYHKNLKNLYDHPFTKKLWKQASEWSVKQKKPFTKFENIPNEIQTLIAKNKNYLLLFKDLITLLKDHFDTNSNNNQINLEYLYCFHKLFNRIEQIVEHYPKLFEQQTELEYLRIIKQIYQNEIKTENLSMEGEPLTGLQVMGLLETRTLNFENIIMLSVNEGTIPQGKTNNSFIPFDIKLSMGMFTHKETDAIYAYHFYRVLQEAKNVHLIYNNSADAEESRFVKQLEQECNQNIQRVSYTPYKTDSVQKNEVQKTPEIIDKIKKLFVREIQSETKEGVRRGISPSAINTYLKNPIKFYQKYILNIKETQTINEEIQSNSLGTVIHNVLEGLYTPLKGKNIPAQQIQNLNNEQLIIQKVEKEFQNQTFLESNFGMNKISKEMAIKMIRNFLENEILNLEDALILEGLELPLQCELKLDDGTPVYINGIADRIDDTIEGIRIIDYKTGSVNINDLKANEENIKDKDKVIQLMLYAYMYQKMNPNITFLKSGIIDMNNTQQWIMNVHFDKKEGIDQTTLQDFEIVIKDILTEILDINVPFVNKG